VRPWYAWPWPPPRRVSWQLPSQGAEPLAKPRVGGNRLRPKPFAPALPVGMDCALSKSRDRPESRRAPPQGSPPSGLTPAPPVRRGGHRSGGAAEGHALTTQGHIPMNTCASCTTVYSGVLRCRCGLWYCAPVNLCDRRVCSANVAVGRIRRKPVTSSCMAWNQAPHCPY